MKKIIVILVLLFVILLYFGKLNESNEEQNYIEAPIKLKIIIGKKLEQRFILIDKENNKKIGSIFKEVRKFEKVAGKLIAIVKVESGKYGYIDSDANWVFKPIFDDVRTFSEENIARVKIGKKWGFIKPDGRWLIKEKFSYVGAFAHNYAFVKEDNGLFHYINTKGEKAFNGKFSYASNFCENQQAVVSMVKSTSTNSREFYGRIDEKGKIVEPFIHLKKAQAMQGCTRKSNMITVNMYSVGAKNNKWGTSEENEIIKFFPSNIVSPLDCNDLLSYVDEKVPMVDKEGGLVYFDNHARLNYRFSSNKIGTMSLYNEQDKEIWRSNIKTLKVEPCQLEKETEEELEKKRKLSILKSTQLKWDIPSNKICILNGGKINRGVCSATWLNAIKICKKSLGRLPTLNELEGIVMGCGGKLKDDTKAEKKKNSLNTLYQTCYKNKKFTSATYWSSSYEEDFAHYIWLVEFNNGSVGAGLRTYDYNVKCVR